MVQAIRLDDKTELIIDRAEQAAERAEEAARQAGKIRDYLALLGVAAPGAILTGWLANQITQPFTPTPTAGPGMSQAQPTLDPNAVFGLVKSLVDAEIQLFTQGLISAAQLEARIAAFVATGFYTTANDVRNIVASSLAAIPSAISLGIQDVDNEINRLLPGLIPTFLTPLVNQLNSAINGINVAISLVNQIPGVKIPTIPTVSTVTPTVSTVTPQSASSGYTIVSGPWPTQAAAQSQNIPSGIIFQGTDGQWYVQQPTITGGSH